MPEPSQAMDETHAVARTTIDELLGRCAPPEPVLPAEALQAMRAGAARGYRSSLAAALPAAGARLVN